MKKIILLIVLLSTIPLAAQSKESGVSVHADGDHIEVKAGTPEPAKPVVIEKTVVQPAKGGCGCSLSSGAPCK